ncbi:MAG TPA: DUF5916 domain-containing protein [Flavobacteriaceae bacterium]|nr:DUF5916 domain-containing protein [Flavobacteriaceae bacterium]
MKFRLIFFSLLLFNYISIYAQEKKTLNIVRTDTPPKIDGVLDDAIWQTAEEATNFVEFRPDMGVTLKPFQSTVVKMTYDDHAVYVGAYLKDKPENIMKQFNHRDNFGQQDFFGVVLNPNNDAQNDTEFFVFPSGNQADAIASPSNGEDFGWNAVWESAVKIVDDGWVVEMKIPYRTLRFSNREVQTWGLQFHRRFRINDSQYTWNPIDRTKGNIGLYHGELKGIKNIEPPTRLTFYPFVSGLATTSDGDSNTDFNVGLDLKYGITENFTLDATLIPDFSQAAFDNVTLNLGPFEQTYSEQRQFFKEGVDLFDKGDLFFSRRIGNAPAGDPELADNEEANIPEEVKVLNAVKISGRTKKGLGVGFFNAITDVTRATIKDTITGQTRTEVVEPLANYNILVLDQQFHGNSSVSFINTNVTREGHFRDANVTGILADITNKRNTYNIRGQIKMSNVNNASGTGTETGFSSFFAIRKAHGNFRYSFDHSLADDKYDINDLGLILRNNYNNFGADASYRIFEPTKKLNNFSIGTYINYKRLFDPSVYTGTNFGMHLDAQTKKLLWFGFNFNFEPGKQYDYFEPRDFENKRYFVYKNTMSLSGWFETNSNKTISLDGNLGAFTLFDKERDLFGYFMGLEPTVRFNDKFRMSYDISYENNKGTRGFVGNIGDDIIFGERDVVSIENSISGAYNFSPFHSLTLTFRNFWSTVTYDHNLFTLLDDGSLSADDGYTVNSLDNPNINFNTWNLDFRYSWEFAPGSQLTALYRNSLFNQDTSSRDSYFDSLSTLFKQPIQHTFSLRLQYFIDYNNVKDIFKKKTDS